MKSNLVLGRPTAWICVAVFAAFTPLLSQLLSAPLAAQAPFQVEEATISQIHAAMRAKRLTCRALVEQYLKRIEAYDKQGPALNAITVVNPDAAKQAAELDQRFAKSGLTGPLHCVPMIVKDNFETIGLQSAGGSITLHGFVSDRDAFQVKQIKAAGAIVLAKSNMGEFAFSPYETLNSLQGHTKNPYALDRVPAGSSGGTAAAVAASFGAVGLGSDTGNSIRGPSSHAALVGIRSTMGLTSRAGVIPLSYLADIAGPMARTVEDAVAVFQVIVGEDPDDAMTSRSRGRTVPVFAKSLVRDGLKGARIGVLRQAYEQPSRLRRAAGGGRRDRDRVCKGDRGLEGRRGGSRRSGGRRLEQRPAGARRGRVPRLQVRHQRLPRHARRARARAQP